MDAEADDDECEQDGQESETEENDVIIFKSLCKLQQYFIVDT